MSNAKDLPVNMYDQRLLACAAIVRNSIGDFDMGTWKCGTACCAIGFYAEAEVGAMRLESMRFANAGRGPASINWSPVNRERNLIAHGWLAVEFEFDLNMKDAMFLFGPEFYSWPQPTRDMVADRIEAFVAERIAARETANV